MGNRKPPAADGVAPELSQGAWRDRTFTPRRVMSADAIVGALRSALDEAMRGQKSVEAMYQQLKVAWLSTLRQAIEQAGDDGLNAWLMEILRGGPRRSKDELFENITLKMREIRVSESIDQLKTHAMELITLVDGSVHSPNRRALSLKQLEKELEGKIDVHELLEIRLQNDTELGARLGDIEFAMERLRSQMTHSPGQTPQGMYASFTRLKAERRAIDAEMKHRKDIFR